MEQLQPTPFVTIYLKLKVEDIVKQGIKTGLQVAAKGSSRIVPLTENSAK